MNLLSDGWVEGRGGLDGGEGGEEERERQKLIVIIMSFVHLLFN